MSNISIINHSASRGNPACVVNEKVWYVKAEKICSLYTNSTVQASLYPTRNRRETEENNKTVGYGLAHTAGLSKKCGLFEFVFFMN